MNFLMGLLLIKNKFNVIKVIVDILMKIVRFIFMKDIKLYGILKGIELNNYFRFLLNF